jgi:hypothetical protein
VIILKDSCLFSINSLVASLSMLILRGDDLFASLLLLESVVTLCPFPYCPVGVALNVSYA